MNSNALANKRRDDSKRGNIMNKYYITIGEG